MTTWRRRRIGANRQDFRIAFLQKLAGAGKRATGAHRGNKGRHFARSLFPDFRAGGFVMGQAIVSVVELVGPKPAVLLREPLCLAVVVARIAVGLLRHRDHSGAQRPKQLDFFRRLGFRYDDDRWIPSARPTMARPIPVLPAVPSMIVSPGFSFPAASASVMMLYAVRSLTEPPGFMNSALARISQPVNLDRRRKRTSGVPPI